MKVTHLCCAGLDVHKDSVVACVRRSAKRTVEHEVRTFATTTQELLELAEWLAGSGCTHAVMEATGVYWKPVWYVLEGYVELVLGNAAHVRNVPGRKSDVNDATWLADLLAHGLIQPSFVPPRPIQQLRDLTRTRKQLRREIVRHAQRIDAVLQEGNIKLSSVISSLLGMSGRRILKAMSQGESDPERLAELGSERLACSKSTLAQALTGRLDEHHRFLLAQHLSLVEQVETSIAAFDARIDRLLEPFRDAVDRLTEIPGVSQVAAQVIVAEIGLDMQRFPTVGHLLSWAGLCPRLDESAGKIRSRRVRQGAPWLKPVLVQCAWAASHSKKTYLSAQFQRLKSRRGPLKAAIAVAASILTAAYFILRNGASYRDLGGDYFVRRDKARVAMRLAKRIRDLGFEVELRQAA